MNPPQKASIFSALFQVACEVRGTPVKKLHQLVFMNSTI